MNKIHVEEGTRPLCRQHRLYAPMVSVDQFWQTAPAKRCRRCEGGLGVNLLPDRERLSGQQKSLLLLIARRVQADGWCPARRLYDLRNPRQMTSVHRSLRRLIGRSLLKQKYSANRKFIRLPERVTTNSFGEIEVDGQMVIS